jgi:hypothetical protein
LHDETAVTVNGSDHQLEGWIDNRPGLFRIEVLHQFHRAFDVSEQPRYGLALTVCHVRRGRLG